MTGSWKLGGALVLDGDITSDCLAAMFDYHGDGIASYCQPEITVSLGLGEGLNNTIRVLQRHAYAYPNEDDLKLKIVATSLHSLTRREEKDPL